MILISWRKHSVHLYVITTYLQRLSMILKKEDRTNISMLKSHSYCNQIHNSQSHAEDSLLRQIYQASCIRHPCTPGKPATMRTSLAVSQHSALWRTNDLRAYSKPRRISHVGYSGGVPQTDHMSGAEWLRGWDVRRPPLFRPDRVPFSACGVRICRQKFKVMVNFFLISWQLIGCIASSDKSDKHSRPLYRLQVQFKSKSVDWLGRCLQ